MLPFLYSATVVGKEPEEEGGGLERDWVRLFAKPVKETVGGMSGYGHKVLEYGQQGALRFVIRVQWVIAKFRQ